jgi:hypothetical protein
LICSAVPASLSKWALRGSSSAGLADNRRVSKGTPRSTDSAKGCVPKMASAWGTVASAMVFDTSGFDANVVGEEGGESEGWNWSPTQKR